MHRQNRPNAAKLERKITITYRVHRILGDPRLSFGINKSKLDRHEFTVERKGRAGDRAAAEGTDICSLEAIGQTSVISVEHLNISQQVMSEIDRLRALQVRVARDNNIDISPGQFSEGPLQISNLPL